jgi:hypothetical protein
MKVGGRHSSAGGLNRARWGWCKSTIYINKHNSWRSFPISLFTASSREGSGDRRSCERNSIQRTDFEGKGATFRQADREIRRRKRCGTGWNICFVVCATPNRASKFAL